MNNEEIASPPPDEARNPYLSETEGAERMIPILETMPPIAVVGYYQHWNRIERALTSKQHKGVELTSEEETILQEADATAAHIGLALELLPSRNIEHARSIITAMTQSPLDDDRESATYFIGNLTKYDHDAGIKLWHRLLSDPNASIRISAHQSLPDTSLVDHPETLAKELAASGLTRDDFSQLQWAYLDHEEASDSRR